MMCDAKREITNRSKVLPGAVARHLGESGGMGIKLEKTYLEDGLGYILFCVSVLLLPKECQSRVHVGPLLPPFLIKR